jgi:hypothetical protein
MGDSQTVGELVCAGGIPYSAHKGLRPFRDAKFAKGLPGLSSPNGFIVQNGINFRSWIKTALPAFAAHCHNGFRPRESGMDREHIDVAVIGILIQNKIRMILARQELDVVLDEIPLVDEILLDDLLQYVFFGGHDSQSLSLSIQPYQQFSKAQGMDVA